MIFERIVCGIDGSPESAEAVRQADLLMARGGHLLLVGAADVAVAVHAGFQAAGIADSIETETRDAILRAEKSVAYGHQAHPRLLKGRPVSCLISAAREEDATLVAVGTHGAGRMVGILLGSVATAMLHEAPCSVLLARSGVADSSPGRSLWVTTDLVRLAQLPKSGRSLQHASSRIFPCLPRPVGGSWTSTVFGTSSTSNSTNESLWMRLWKLPRDLTS